MAIDNFIPAVWAGALLRNLHKNLVFSQPSVINRDYEGDIKDQGDTVKINNIGPVTIGDYTKNTNISDPQALTSAQQALQITYAKFYNFQVDDIDAAQSKPKVMNEAMYEAAYGLANTQDGIVAGLYTGAAAQNVTGSTGSPIIIAPATASGVVGAYEALISMKTALDVANVPNVDRWVGVPPWFEGMLLKDPRYVSFGTPQNRMTLQDGMLGDQTVNGQVGSAAGFNILRSNNVPNPTGSVYALIAGHKIAWTLADSLVKTEAYRPPLRFADAVKGLHVYGCKVVRPAALSVQYVQSS